MSWTYETPRLRLRPLVPADAGPMEQYLSDLRVVRMLAKVPHPYPPGLATPYIAASAADQPTKLVRAIEHGRGREAQLIGTVSLRDGHDLGYWLGAPFWGVGFMTEALGAFCDAAFRDGATCLKAGVFQDNPRSSRVLTKLGFAYVGAGKVFSLARGEEVPEWHYAKQAAGDGD